MCVVNHGPMNCQPTPCLHIERYPSPRQSLRVAVVTETYPPEVNGVAITVERLVHGLQARDHDLQVIRPRQEAHDRDASAPLGMEQVLLRGLPIPRYPQLRMGMPAKKALLRLWTLRRPDVVHIATEGPLGWSALQAARKLQLPISSDFRTNFHAYSRHYGAGWLQKPVAAYLRKFHNLAHLTMVPTPALQAQLAALGFERLQVVARGVDTQRFHPAHRSLALREGWGVAPQDLVVLSVGRLAAEKNLGLLIQAYEAMRAIQPRTRLVVVGDGPEREALQARCPSALLVGAQRGHDLATHYASADVFLFPSLTETYGNVTPEALASGLAVVAFDCAAAAELITHGHNGLLVPVSEPSAFVRRAQDLAEQPASVERLRQQARSSTQSLDWAAIVGQVETLWHALMHQAARSA
jgi:glycosyltransferase involved in cell wall biosynthesis